MHGAQAPDPGVNVERSSVIKQSLDRSMPLAGYKPVGWFRTMVEWDKSFEMHQWAKDCDGN